MKIKSRIKTPESTIEILEGYDFLYYYSILGESEARQTKGYGKQTINESIDVAIDYVSNNEKFNTYYFELTNSYFGADKEYISIKANDYLSAVSKLKNSDINALMDDYNLIEVYCA